MTKIFDLITRHEFLRRFLLDQASAERLVDPRLADVLFILTISNSVVNPYVYGSYASEMRGKCLKWWCGARRRSAPRSPSGILPIDSRSRFLPSLRLGNNWFPLEFCCCESPVPGLEPATSAGCDTLKPHREQIIVAR